MSCNAKYHQIMKLSKFPRRNIYIDGKGHLGMVDKIQIFAQGGKGGKGVTSLMKMRDGKLIPNGGHGGNGGNVYVKESWDKFDLKLGQMRFKAGDGFDGTGSDMHGKKGSDLVFEVPVGTIITKIEELNLSSINKPTLPFDQPIDLSDYHNMLLLANGGRSGFGNLGLDYEDEKNFERHRHKQGEFGDEIVYVLELKKIADIGMVGYPNSGKSTLLGSLTKTKPRVADYPFTTLVPTVGAIQYRDYKSITMADIPGLIEGASENRGLGHEFLRHIERTKAILYVIDVANSSDPLNEFDILRNELHLYNRKLTQLPHVIAATKIDIAEPFNPQLLACHAKTTVIPVSSKFPDKLSNLAKILRNLVLTY